jgi:hypothetical protein
MVRKKLKKSRSNHNIVASGLIIAALTILGIIFKTYFSVTSERGSINKENFCAEEIKEMTVVVIDHSDKLNTIQKAALQARLWDIVENMPKNYFQIRIFSADKISENVLTPELVLCNPGSEKEMSRFTENQKIVRKQYEEKFKKHLDEILNGILNKDSASQSPIMEAVQSVAVTSFIGERNKHIQKKLILVSDLLQHTANFSLYNGGTDFENYKTSNHWKSVKSDLNDVEVELYFLHRDEDAKLQNSKLREFWIQFFENQGAKVTRFLPIEG